MAPQQSTPEQTHLNTLAVTNELVADEQLRVHHALAADAPVPVHGTNNKTGGRPPGQAVELGNTTRPHTPYLLRASLFSGRSQLSSSYRTLAVSSRNLTQEMLSWCRPI